MIIENQKCPKHFAIRSEKKKTDSCDQSSGYNSIGLSTSSETGTESPATRAVLMRNRRIQTMMSGGYDSILHEMKGSKFEIVQKDIGYSSDADMSDACEVSFIHLSLSLNLQDPTSISDHFFQSTILLSCDVSLHPLSRFFSFFFLQVIFSQHSPPFLDSLNSVVTSSTAASSFPTPHLVVVLFITQYFFHLPLFIQLPPRRKDSGILKPSIDSFIYFFFICTSVLTNHESFLPSFHAFTVITRNLLVDSFLSFLFKSSSSVPSSLILFFTLITSAPFQNPHPNRFYSQQSDHSAATTISLSL